MYPLGMPTVSQRDHRCISESPDPRHEFVAVKWISVVGRRARLVSEVVARSTEPPSSSPEHARIAFASRLRVAFSEMPALPPR